MKLPFIVRPLFVMVLFAVAVSTHAQLVKLGVSADLHVWEGLEHGFINDPELPEAREAYDVITRFFARHLQLALGNLELLGDHIQVALKVSVRLLVLSKAVLQRRYVLLHRLLRRLQLRGYRLLGGVKLG